MDEASGLFPTRKGVTYCGASWLGGRAAPPENGSPALGPEESGCSPGDGRQSGEVTRHHRAVGIVGEAGALRAGAGAVDGVAACAATGEGVDTRMVHRAPAVGASHGCVCLSVAGRYFHLEIPPLCSAALRATTQKRGSGRSCQSARRGPASSVGGVRRGAGGVRAGRGDEGGESDGVSSSFTERELASISNREVTFNRHFHHLRRLREAPGPGVGSLSDPDAAFTPPTGRSAVRPRRRPASRRRRARCRNGGRGGPHGRP